MLFWEREAYKTPPWRRDCLANKRASENGPKRVHRYENSEVDPQCFEISFSSLQIRISIACWQLSDARITKSCLFCRLSEVRQAERLRTAAADTRLVGLKARAVEDTTCLLSKTHPFPWPTSHIHWSVERPERDEEMPVTSSSCQQLCTEECPHKT